jgi:hypothetical protein
MPKRTFVVGIFPVKYSHSEYFSFAVLLQFQIEAGVEE